MKEWDYDKNNSLDPAKIYYNSNLKVWWKCVKGHSWLAKISSRFKSGCPYCQGKLVSEENCLATKYPSIATEWDFAKNIGSPKDYTAHSGKKFWWICRTCGNNWQATINKRTMVEDAQFVQKKNENQDILQKRMITFYQRKCQILLLIGIMIKILYLQTIILLLVIKKFGGSALRNMNLVLKLANLQKVKDVQFAQGKKLYKVLMIFYISSETKARMGF